MGNHGGAEEPLDYGLLRKVNVYIRGHYFIQQSMQQHTISERRNFERNVYDYARSVGLRKAQARREVIRGRSFCGELDYDSEASALGEEIDDSAEIVKALKESSIGLALPVDGDGREHLKAVPKASTSTKYTKEKGDVKKGKLLGGPQKHEAPGVEKATVDNSKASPAVPQAEPPQVKKKKRKQPESAQQPTGADGDILPSGKKLKKTSTQEPIEGERTREKHVGSTLPANHPVNASSLPRQDEDILGTVISRGPSEMGSGQVKTVSKGQDHSSVAKKGVVSNSATEIPEKPGKPEKPVKDKKKTAQRKIGDGHQVQDGQVSTMEHHQLLPSSDQDTNGRLGEQEVARILEQGVEKYTTYDINAVNQARPGAKAKKRKAEGKDDEQKSESKTSSSAVKKAKNSIAKSPYFSENSPQKQVDLVLPDEREKTPLADAHPNDVDQRPAMDATASAKKPYKRPKLKDKQGTKISAEAVAREGNEQSPSETTAPEHPPSTTTPDVRAAKDSAESDKEPTAKVRNTATKPKKLRAPKSTGIEAGAQGPISLEKPTSEAQPPADENTPEGDSWLSKVKWSFGFANPPETPKKVSKSKRQSQVAGLEEVVVADF